MTNEQALGQMNEIIACWEEILMSEENDDLKGTGLELETLRMAARALESKPRWIPCSERMPSDENKVLCCTQTKAGTKNVVLGYYADGKWRCGMNSNVVAWMPLPEVYSGSEQE